MKSFFNKLKQDFKFKQAGKGQKLNHPTPAQKPTQSRSSEPSSSSSSASAKPTDAANKARAAAEARMMAKMGMKPTMSRSTASIQAKAREELEAKRGAEREKEFVESLQAPKEEKIDETALLSVNGVFYECPLSGEIIRKSQYIDHLETVLEGWSDAPLESSVFKIHCLNTNREQREKAIEILGKYNRNVIDNPDEEKYRKIKLENKAFVEKVASQKGCIDFLKALGWIEAEIDGLKFLVFQTSETCNVETLTAGLEALATEDLPKPKLYRNSRILEPEEAATRITVPDEFFKVSGSELKKVQVDRELQNRQKDMLMTKSMREAANKKTDRQYSYTLIRFRFPNSCCLQGTFNAYEKGSDLMDFVRGSLVDDFNWLPFKLKQADGVCITSDNEEILSNTLVELKSVPGALLTFMIPEDMRDQIPANILR